MNWLKNNPLGIVLAATGGFFLLASLLLAWAWTRPVSSTGLFENPDQQVAAIPLGENDILAPLESYAVINDRPVFEESRTPTLEAEEDVTDIEDESVTIAGAPEVRLSGIVITPERSFVTFTPNEGGESLVAAMGAPLEGDYVGWEVSAVNERDVVLTSLEGDELTLDLEIHKSVIRAPAKQARKSPASNKPPTLTQPPPAVADSSDAPVSRAEQIRQRIQQRREELRRNSNSNSGGNSTPAAPKPQDKAMQDGQVNYQDAIDKLMNPGNSSGGQVGVEDS
jgi:hypothetical protein